MARQARALATCTDKTKRKSKGEAKGDAEKTRNGPWPTTTGSCFWASSNCGVEEGERRRGGCERGLDGRLMQRAGS